MNRKIVLASRPVGMPSLDNFTIVESAIPHAGDGEFVIRHAYLGLAPGARLRMSDTSSYSSPLPLGSVIHGQAVGAIVESRHPDFRVGEWVVSMSGGWQEYSASNGAGVVRIDQNIASITSWLGPMGVSGLTAYVGLIEIGKIQRGGTMVVSAASGAVGSVAGQIAKNVFGCQVIGIAGGMRKCAYVTDELGFDACIDYKDPHFALSLEKACRKGVDLYFENVGGSVRDTLWPLLNRHASVVVCGLISEYNADPVAAPSWFEILAKRLKLRGFIVSDHRAMLPAFLKDMASWIGAGFIKGREDITEGFQHTPAAFIGMLQGNNFGKTIVKL